MKNNKAINKHEKQLNKLLQKHFPNEFKYVGNGEVWIDGKNPDFININGKKIIIELFGDYWHNPKRKGIKYHQTEQGTIKHYKKYGFKTLVIWENELKDKNLIINKIKDFMENNFKNG